MVQNNSKTKRTTQSNKTATRRKPAAKSPNRQAKPAGDSHTKEFIGVFLIVIAAILFIGIFLPKGAESSVIGAVGTILTAFSKSIAGIGAVMLPLFLLILGVLLVVDKKSAFSLRLICGTVLLFWPVLGYLHAGQPMMGFVAYLNNGLAGVGGGLLGALIDFCLLNLFGKIGCYLILGAMILISILLFANITLLDIFRKIRSSFSDGRAKAKENKAARALASADEKQQQPVRIISHDDKPQMPVIKDEPPVIPKEAPPKTGFSKEYLPVVSSGATEEQAEEPVVTKAAAAAKTYPQANSVPPVANLPEAAVAVGGYQLPTVELLTQNIRIHNSRLNKTITNSVSVLEDVLASFGVKARVTQVVDGPAVTRYELEPAPGVKVSKITGLADDIALSLAAPDVRIAPIPGKSVVGVEVPKAEVSMVYFRDVIADEGFAKTDSLLSFAVGKNIGGDCIVGDLAKMPHLLIAGATGSGKSICLNAIICSFLFKAKPDELKLILIDPKRVELSNYNRLPHLLTPVVIDNKKAAGCLKWAVLEMENRYSLFASNAVKDFQSYNRQRPDAPLPQIVIIIDELADLMMVAPADVEESICRLAQMARAAGIHLIVATQRPSVNVITGLIKANIPSRIAFAVTSFVDSRTILDMGGAEKLLGRGDMLYHPAGAIKPQRVQGTYIGEGDIQTLVDYCTKQAAPQFTQEESLAAAAEKTVGSTTNEAAADEDPLFREAAQVIITTGQASTSFLQRRLRIGNPRAGRLIDILEANGVVGGPDGSKPRAILMSWEEFVEKFG